VLNFSFAGSMKNADLHIQPATRALQPVFRFFKLKNHLTISARLFVFFFLYFFLQEFFGFFNPAMAGEASTEAAIASEPLLWMWFTAAVLVLLTPAIVLAKRLKTIGRTLKNQLQRSLTGKEEAQDGDAKQILTASEEKYRTLLDTIEDGYYEVDLAGNIKQFNKAMARMLQYSAEELKGKNYLEFVDANDKITIFKTFNQVYRTGNPVKVFDWRLIRKNNILCHVETSVSLNLDKNNVPTGFSGIIRDLTDRYEGEKRRKELEAQLHQSQKLESLGTLAGGIAHDLNNILFPMIGYTEMTMEELPANSPLRDNLDKVMKSANRAKAMIQQILAFGRQRSDEYAEPVQIEPVIMETVDFLRNSFPSTISIEKKIAGSIGKVSINASSFHQVIMNLCTNALHAMEDQPSGRLEISVEQRHMTESDTALYRDLMVGDYVRICVADNGIGIGPEVAGKIFEPYFTTKPQDKGTGLGLSVSYGIIKNAGGIITVSSIPGNGSNFEIILPVADCHASIPLKRAEFYLPLPTGTETVLLVDDEHRIVELEKQMIESLGYTVIPRTSSIEALAAFRHNPAKFDIVITDQTMPNMNGIEFAKNILSIRPDIPVIICTGFSEKVTMEKIDAMGIKGILTKPIPKSELAVVVRRALDGRRHFKHSQ
jgi:two-component system, cell cycle sensor histidine kinase and response regulator CckA